MLMQTCLDGSGSAHQQGVSASLRKGETLPLSAGLSTQFEFDARFAQRSVRLDIDRLESQCARILNHPLDRGLRFELRPFLTPQLSTSVTSAALECGFVHLARFSGYYKTAFGESPAQTLRRSRAEFPAHP